MSRRAFRNALAILRNLEMEELRDAGVVRGFQDVFELDTDALGFLLKLDDQREAALWRLIQTRQPVELREAA